jgi:hypothetical protein
MSLRTWRFITLFLAACGMAMGLAHILELPAKMRYDATLYAAVNTTLYQLYGVVGALVSVLTIVAAVVLSVLSRRRPSFSFALLGTMCLLLSLGLWFTLVQPVNLEWHRALQSTAASVPEIFLHFRDEWEYGHVATFVAWLAGFAFLLRSVIVETPSDQSVVVVDVTARPQRVPARLPLDAPQSAGT